MTAKNKIHSRRITRSLQRSGIGNFFRKLSDNKHIPEYVSVMSEVNPLLIHLVPSENG